MTKRIKPNKMNQYETLFKASSIDRKIDTIILHCAAVQCASHITTEDIGRDHIENRHFRDIGYHFVVDERGVIHIGRPLNEMGAHCKGHNATSIGICYIGGLDSGGNPADTRTPLQQLAIKQLIGLLVNEFKIYDVLGHRDLSPDVNGDGQITSVDWVKMCPCYDAHAEWLAYLRELAIVARNYAHATCTQGVPVDDALMNLCESADEYLELEASEKMPPWVSLDGVLEMPVQGGLATSEPDDKVIERWKLPAFRNRGMGMRFQKMCGGRRFS